LPARPAPESRVFLLVRCMRYMNHNKQTPWGTIFIFVPLAAVVGTVVLKFLPNDMQRISV